LDFSKSYQQFNIKTADPFPVTSRSPFWRTPKESCKGLGSVSLKNKHSTHTPPPGRLARRRACIWRERERRSEKELELIRNGDLHRSRSTAYYLKRSLRQANHCVLPSVHCKGIRDDFVYACRRYMFRESFTGQYGGERLLYI